MENIVFGIAILLGAFISYFYSWKSFKKDDYNTAVLFITFSGLLFFIYSSTDFFLHEWDERYHALVAKNLMNHPLIPTLYENPILPYDYKMWVGNHIWLHKQPLPLWFMAGSMKIFGINEIAIRLPSILFSTIGILLTFKIGSFFFNQKIGVLAAFFFSVNGLIIELTGGRIATDHIDIAFMFFILLAIYLITVFLKRKTIIYTILIGISVGAAVLTKWLTGLIVLPIWLLLIWDEGHLNMKQIIFHFTLILLSITVVALPWQLYIFNEFPQEATYESQFNLRHFTEVIEDQAGSIFYFINRIRINYGELIYLPLIWFLSKISKRPKNLKQLALLIWFLVPLFVFSLAKTKMQGYLLFTAPALFIITSSFFFELKNYGFSLSPKWLVNLVLALLIIFPVRYGIERMKPFENRNRKPNWVLDLKKLGTKNIQKGVLFNYDNPIEAMFYTDLTAYSNIPTKEEIEQLLNQGYQVIINNADSLENFKHLKGVQIIKLAPPNK